MGLFGPTAGRLGLAFIPDMLRCPNIHCSVCCVGDYEKCFFSRQAGAFSFKRYVLILSPYRTVVWTFQLKASDRGGVICVWTINVYEGYILECSKNRQCVCACACTPKVFVYMYVNMFEYISRCVSAYARMCVYVCVDMCESVYALLYM